MKAIKKLFPLCAVLILTASCGSANIHRTDKADDKAIDAETATAKITNVIPEGIYEGTFTVAYSKESGFGFRGTESGPVTVTLQDGRYQCSGNPNRVPARAEGSYTVADGKITFLSEGFYTADFDWNLILSGEYDYVLDGSNLTFGASKGNGMAYYEYVLVKN